MAGNTINKVSEDYPASTQGRTSVRYGAVAPTPSLKRRRSYPAEGQSKQVIQAFREHGLACPHGWTVIETSESDQIGYEGMFAVPRKFAESLNGRFLHCRDHAMRVFREWLLSLDSWERKRFMDTITGGRATTKRHTARNTEVARRLIP